MRNYWQLGNRQLADVLAPHGPQPRRPASRVPARAHVGVIGRGRNSASEIRWAIPAFVEETPEGYEPEELEAILRACDDRHRAAYLGILQSPLREGEAANLTCDRFDAKCGMLHVKASDDWSPKKRRERSVKIPRELANVIGALPRISRYVFALRRPRPPHARVIEAGEGQGRRRSGRLLSPQIQELRRDPTAARRDDVARRDVPGRVARTWPEVQRYLLLRPATGWLRLWKGPGLDTRCAPGAILQV